MSDRERSGPETGATPERRQPRAARRDVTGILVLDKPVGLTSNAALQRVRRLYGARKAGHTGSLDPLASGVLPVCLGEATKISGLLLDAPKTYEVVARLGSRTDTGDAAGKVVERRDWSQVDTGSVDVALARFRGPIEQVPPMFSALKHKGRRLYELARRGETVERSPRPVTIHALEAIGLEGRDLHLRVCCSKGTYVRTLAEDIAAALGTVAHLASLRRVSAGCFDASDTVTLDAAEEAAVEGREALDGLLLPPDAALEDLQAVRLDAEQARRIRCGQQLPSPAEGEGVVRIYGPDKAFLGLAELRGDGLMAPRRMFNVRTACEAEGQSAAASGKLVDDPARGVQ